MTFPQAWVLDGDRPTELGNLSPERVLRAAGDGLYEGFRTFDGVRICRWGAHVLRLEAGRASLQLGTPLDLAALGRGFGRILDQLQSDHPGLDWKLRLDVAEADFGALGAAGAGHRVAVLAWPLAEVPASILQDGADCALERELLRDRPEIKGTPYSLKRMFHPFPGGNNYESLLVQGGRLLEGVMSGLVLRLGDELRTAGRGVLPSITVEEACALGQQQGLRLRREAVALKELGQVDGAFLATSVRGLVPLRSIDGKVLGRDGGETMDWIRDLRQQHLEQAEACAIRPDSRDIGEPTAP